MVKNKIDTVMKEGIAPDYDTSWINPVGKGTAYHYFFRGGLMISEVKMDDIVYRLNMVNNLPQEELKAFFDYAKRKSEEDDNV